jgi:hypothetical protein
VVYGSDRIVALCGTGWGQLGESGEYRMRRNESEPFDIRSSDGDSPCLCRWRINRLSPVSKIDYVMVHMGHMESRKLSSFDSHQVGRSLTSPIVMYIGIVYRPPMDSPVCGSMWKTYTRERCNPARLFDCCHELWPLVSPSWLTCVVLSGYFSCKDVNWLKSPWNPRRMILACCNHSV